MPAQNLLRITHSGIYSHVYNKGVEHRSIFKDDQDFETFEGFLKEYLTLPRNKDEAKKDFEIRGRTFKGTPHQPKNYFNQVELIAYCLMPDHFHLLLYQTTESAIQNFMRSLATRYSIYFNKRYHRSGSLFVGPYKSVGIEDKTQLLQLTRHIHAHKSVHSSYPEYLGKRESLWVNSKVVLSANTEVNNYKKFVEEHKPDPKEIELLDKISLEKADVVLAQEPSAPKKAHNPKLGSQTKRQPRRIPEFLAITTSFFVLLGLGIRNINASSTSNMSIALPIPLVSGVSSESPNQTPIPTPEEVQVMEEVEVKPTLLVIKITDGVTSVNIRQKPSVQSEKIGEAKDGESFKEYSSIDSKWYEIKLPDGSTGYISTGYALLQQTSY